MRYFHKKTFSMAFFMICFLCVNNELSADTPEQPVCFEDSAKAMRKVWSLLRPPRLDKVSKESTVEALNYLTKNRNSNTYAHSIYMHLYGRALALNDQKEKALKYLQRDSIVMGVESFYDTSLLLPVPDRHNWDEFAARVLPVSSIASISGYSLKRTYEGPVLMDRRVVKLLAIPYRLDLRSLNTIAMLLEKIGNYDLAWRARCETLYAAYPPGPLDLYYYGSSLYPLAASQWFQVAHCARLAGKKQLAWGFLCKAAVFGDEKLYQQTLDVAKKWEAEDKNGGKEVTDSQPVAVSLEVKREALTKAIHLYAEMNCHPRALALIEMYKEILEEPETLRKEIATGWLAFVKDLSQSDVKKVVIYGTEVYPNGDPLKVKIPWAFSDEAMKSVRKKIGSVVVHPLLQPESDGNSD